MEFLNLFFQVDFWVILNFDAILNYILKVFSSHCEWHIRKEWLLYKELVLSSFVELSF